MKNALFPLFFLVSSLSLSAQPNDVPVLSAAEAVQIALANNYDIQLARADAEIAPEPQAVGWVGGCEADRGRHARRRPDL